MQFFIFDWIPGIMPKYSQTNDDFFLSSSNYRDLLLDVLLVVDMLSVVFPQKDFQKLAKIDFPL
jgi:hypothetical protein